MNGTRPWITEREFVWEFVDKADLKGFISALIKIVPPASKDQLPHTPFKMSHLALAESELKHYQVDLWDPFSDSMKDRDEGTRAFDKFVTAMNQQSHTIETKTK